MATNSVAKLEQEESLKSESLYTKALRRLRRDKITMTALSIVAVFSFLAFFSPFITSTILNIDPNDTNPTKNFLPLMSTITVVEDGVEIQRTHILGTDDVGRDQLARLLHAGRVSLSIGFIGAIVSMAIGLSLGVITGYFGGVVDDLMNFVITTLDSIPSLYLLILIASVMRPTAEALIVAIALISWTGVTRLIRGQTLSIRSLDYVLSARALGASSLRIMFVHIMPNLISISVIVMARSVGGLMLAEAGLSFLGLGVQPPQATWGNMLTNSQQYYVSGQHLIFPPGLAIWITVLCFYVIGDGFRDAFDPTSTK